MRTLVTPAPALPRPSADWIGRLFGILLVVGIGVLLGYEYVSPEKRSLAILAAVVVTGIAWRLDTLSGIGILVVFMAFPRGNVFGSTNVAFVLLLAMMWLFRIAQRMAPPPRRTAIDLPLLGLVICYIVSFYNLAKPEHFPLALQQTLLFFSTVIMFYVIVNNVRDERDLMRLHRFQLTALGLILVLGIWELRHPGQALFKGWIEFHGTAGEVFSTRNVRIGGPFFDFELYAEYCALNILLVTLWLVRARSQAARTLLSALLVATVFVLFATVTRGAMISLGVGLLALLWRVRSRLRIVPAVGIATIALSMFLGMNYFVAHFTRSGNLLSRLGQTHLVNGLPDSRAVTWPQAWQRAWEHPIIGHGPYYSIEHGLTYWYWPHDVYLYVANLVGFVGLSFFLWMLIRMLRASWPRVNDLNHPSYVEAYLVIANAQLVLFMVDQVKIEYLRNGIYQYQIWLLFAGIMAAARIARRQRLVAAAPA